MGSQGRHSMSKIEPLKGHFENMQALLARIAEDEKATAFAGVVFTNNDSAHLVTFNCSRRDVAFAGTMLQANSLEPVE